MLDYLKRPLACYLLIFSSLTASAQNGQYVAGDFCVRDDSLNIVLCALTTTVQGSTIKKIGISGSDTLLFSTPVDRIELNLSYSAARRGRDYRVYFTNNPVLSPASEEAIQNEPKVTTEITYIEGNRHFTATAGVELRGATALCYPKKSYDIEFRGSVDGGVDDVSLAGMRSDDDWVLDGLYNEPLRINAYVAQRLWNDVYRLPYDTEEPRGRPGAGVAVVEVFVNGAYRGVYHLGEQVDRKLLRLKKTDPDATRGHLTKIWAIPQQNASKDFGPPAPRSDIWNGYELKYPKPKDTLDWQPVVELHDFFALATDGEIRLDAGRHLDRSNAIDYNLFVNLTGGVDNTTKNIYLARRDKTSPYLFIPWDLDATFGNNWDGSPLPDYDTLYTPLFHDRFDDTDEFKRERCARYSALRTTGPFAVDSLHTRIRTAYEELKTERLYEREALVWVETVRADEGELNYTLDWITQRVAFLDTAICSNEPIISSISSPPNGQVWFYPNPATENITLRLSGVEAGVLYIVDTRGRTVYRASAPRSGQEIYVENLPPGIYTLVVGQIRKKFVKR